MNKEEFDKRFLALAVAHGAINRKWNFCKFENRSEADNIEFRRVTKEIDDLCNQYDLEHPHPPCPECGKRIRASLRSCCSNPDCKLGVPLGG